MKDLNKKVKKLDILDIKLIELTSASFILFLITVWPALMILVHKIHWGWFLALSVIFAYKPLKKLFF